MAQPRHLSDGHLRLLRRAGLTLTNGISYGQLLAEQSEARRLGCKVPVWRLDNKLRAYRFMDALGLRRPACDLQVYALDELPTRSPCIVKAVHSTGSRGCCRVAGMDDIVHLLDGKRFDSWGAMLDHARWLLEPGRRRVIPDRWMVEELIVAGPDGEPARDVKFYTFYGEVQLIQEIRRVPTHQVAFWLPDGTPTTTGRYTHLHFDGDAASADEVRIAEEISLAIPAPHVRIDMLRGEDGLVLGEFTPRPGKYEDFTPAWDRSMGEAWVRADSRLTEDLLGGKGFAAFVQSTGAVQGATVTPPSPRGTHGTAHGS